MATRTTGALGTSLLVLFLLTKATGQPLTVALLGALITMILRVRRTSPIRVDKASRMALPPLPTALAITAASLLSSHLVVADAGFVLVVFLAVDARRSRPARNGAGHGHLHGLLLHAVSAGEGL